MQTRKGVCAVVFVDCGVCCRHALLHNTLQNVLGSLFRLRFGLQSVEQYRKLLQQSSLVPTIAAAAVLAAILEQGWGQHAGVHHAILTDAIPTIHSRDVGQLTSVEQAYGQYRLERRRTKSRKSGGYWVWHFKILVRKFEKPDPIACTWGSNCMVPRSMPCFRCMQHLDPLQCVSNFYHFYICLRVLKMYWVVVTVDCRNSVCRNSVCLPACCMYYIIRVCLKDAVTT